MDDLIGDEASSSRTSPTGPPPREQRSLITFLNPAEFFHDSMSDSPASTSMRYERFATSIDTDENPALYRRFGCLHARALLYKQADLTGLEEELNNLDEEEHIGMHQMSRDGQQKDRSTFISMLQKKLAEYSKFISETHTALEHTDLRSTKGQTVEQWLCQGPNLRKLIQENDPRWQPYTTSVKAMILDPENNFWLQYNIEDILDSRGNSTSYRGFRADWLRRKLFAGPAERDRQPPENRLRGTAERQEVSTLPRSRSYRTSRALESLFKASFLALSTLMYSVNISSALAYLILVNTPVPQQKAPSDLYWKASLLAWVVSMIFLLVHGLFFGKYTTECYAGRLALISIIFCGGIAFALRALAVNVMSGVLVGFTLSVTFLQIW